MNSKQRLETLHDIARSLHEIADQRDRYKQEIEDLWKYVRAQEAVDRGINDFSLRDEQVLELRRCRDDLRKYEDGS
jgi:hypothetical protein